MAAPLSVLILLFVLFGIAISAFDPVADLVARTLRIPPARTQALVNMVSLTGVAASLLLAVVVS